LILEANFFESAQFVNPQNPQAKVTKALIAPLEQLTASSKTTTQEAVLRMTMIQEKDSSSSEKIHV